ncbi:hypothetical protein LTR62_004135 [Meristemomyces frigidus]|uniref:AAA+ ATPase domain-containing protein n=1 Tax=Meristemomyces frigidus TaxID=1508187 RepID=A0AAN7YSG9_9PEZI|nr:hypothetical protein LTR62_004135 [Meristemomyces frigidus]
MAINDSTFVIRPLPGAGIDGAFRVHLSPDSLEKLGLQHGVDICQITGEKCTGYGIAWRAMDKMGTNPKLRPVKLTSIAQSAFGFEEGSHVTISKSAASRVLATRITLADDTPQEWKNAEDKDFAWQARANVLLDDCEAFAVGMTFEVMVKKKLRKKFYVENVEGPGHPNGNGLFYCGGATSVVISDGPRPDTPSQPPLGDSFPVLNTSLIGGLVEQVQELNRHMDRVLNRASRSGSTSSFEAEARHTILHGYEGTGKSMLIKAIAQTHRPAKVFRIHESDLTTSAKAISLFDKIFDDALRAQPSIITLDNLHQIVPKENRILNAALIQQFEKIRASRVFVLAAVPSLLSIDHLLLDPDTFGIDIELRIPDIAARTAIIRTMLSHEPEALINAVSFKTHGFTGRDLRRLVYKARLYPAQGSESDSAGYVNIGAGAPQSNGSAANGHRHEVSWESQDATEVDRSSLDVESSTAVLTIEAFAFALNKVAPSALREIFFEKPNVRWSDIGGSGSIKAKFDDTIGTPLQHPDLYSKYAMKPRRGILLYGPPGCSKTMTAQAVATMYDLNFIAVKGAELISMYVGESERAIRELFRKARQAAPCIIFFDEIDSIGAERDAGGTKGLNVLTTLLNEMDGFEAMENVLVLAATNKPEVLDPALLRPGRFDAHIYVGLPDVVARREILRMSLKSVMEDPGVTVDLDELADDTAAYSGAEIVAICHVAKERSLVRAVSGADAVLGRGDFEEAFRNVRKGVTEEMLAGYQGFAARG